MAGRIDAAYDNNRRATLKKNMATTLRLESGENVTLVAPDGTVTPAGLHYYGRLGVEPLRTSSR